MYIFHSNYLNFDRENDHFNEFYISCFHRDSTGFCNWSFAVISVITEMYWKPWKLFGLINLAFTLVDARYAFEVYTPSNVTITDCFIQEVMDISHVQCGMHAWRRNIIALVYVDSTKVCHLCLSPREAGNQSRRTLPEGQTVVTTGRLWDWYHENLNKHYRKISNIRLTKSQNLNVSRLVLEWSLPNPMKPGVKSRMKM